MLHPYWYFIWTIFKHKSTNIFYVSPARICWRLLWGIVTCMIHFPTRGELGDWVVPNYAWPHHVGWHWFNIVRWAPSNMVFGGDILVLWVVGLWVSTYVSILPERLVWQLYNLKGIPRDPIVGSPTAIYPLKRCWWDMCRLWWAFYDRECM